MLPSKYYETRTILLLFKILDKMIGKKIDYFPLKVKNAMKIIIFCNPSLNSMSCLWAAADTQTVQAGIIDHSLLLTVL